MKRFLIVVAAVVVLILGCDLAVMIVQNRAESTEEESETQEISEESIQQILELIDYGNTEDALKLLDKEEHDTPEYYALKEMAYVKDGSEDANEKLADLYYDAAERWPKWQHMQQMAGVAAMMEGNYDAAFYRLYETLLLDAEDAETWFYLGACSYYQGDLESMRTYFETALEYGLDEEHQQEMLWYAEKAGDVK